MAGFVGGIPFLIIGSMITSTVLILLNKYLMAYYQFDFPIALTTFHFACTYSVLEILCRFRFFERAENYPSKLGLITACECVCGLLFMNISLKLNSVGFYQLSKLLCIPGMVLANLILFKKKTSPRTCITLIILLIGVALFTVSEVYFSVSGAIVALIAIFFNVIFQVHTNYIYNQYHVGGPAYQLANSGYMFFYGIIATMLEEGRYPHSVFEYVWSVPELVLAFLTGMVAVWSNVFGISLIGKCSAITFQVVGHAKTILIFVFGLIFIDDFKHAPIRYKIRKIVGVSLGMLGTILYSVCKMQEKADQAKKENKDELDQKYEENNSLNMNENVNDPELQPTYNISTLYAFKAVPEEPAPETA